MPNNKYSRFQTPCCCSSTSLEECALRIGPAFVYDLHVAPQAVLRLRSRLREMCCDVKDNVLAPYVNLIEDATLQPEEWFLHANDISYGSEGC